MPFGTMGGKTVSSNRTMVLLGDGAENSTNKKVFFATHGKCLLMGLYGLRAEGIV